MPATAPPYTSADLRDDDWTLRTVHAGAGVVEVTLTLCAAARRRAARLQLCVAAAAALALFAAPLPLGLALPLLPLLDAQAASAAASAALASSPWEWLAVAAAAAARLAALAALLAALPAPVVQESVLALRGLGVQVKSVRRGGAAAVRFVDAGSLRALVVNEGVQRCDVRYYLALVLAGAGAAAAAADADRALLTLFDASRPRLPALASAYRSLLPALFPVETAAAADRVIDRLVAGEGE